MKKRINKPYFSAGVLCRVCNDRNGQPHYGTICCPSCKGFFRRVFLSSKKFECYRGNMCAVRRTNRNLCRACRYKKCLNVGMKTKDIREKHEKSTKKAQPSTDLSSPSSSTSSPPRPVTASVPSSSTSNPIEFKPTRSVLPIIANKPFYEKDGVIEDLNHPEEFELRDAIGMAQVYMNLEKYCENNYCESNMSHEEENSLIDQMLSCTIVELIQKNSPQCPRFRREWKPQEMLNFENFARSWSRSMVHFLDFSTRFPVFNQLPLSDQKVWFISRLVPCTLLTMSYHTRVEQCEGLLFGCNNVFPLKGSQWDEVPDEHLRSLFSLITQTLFDLVILPMINLKLTEVHFALIKAIVFFAQGISVTNVRDDVYEMMRSEHTKHKNALMKLLLNGVDDYSIQSHILFQIEDLFSTLERVSLHFDREIQYFDVLGISIVKKKMLKECHIEKKN